MGGEKVLGAKCSNIVEAVGGEISTKEGYRAMWAARGFDGH